MPMTMQWQILACDTGQNEVFALLLPHPIEEQLNEKCNHRSPLDSSANLTDQCINVETLMPATLQRNLYIQNPREFRDSPRQASTHDGKYHLGYWGKFFIISMEMPPVQHHFENHQEEGMVISHMAVAGIWFACMSGSILHLFHNETLNHLQDINIAIPIHNMSSGQQCVSVTGLMLCHGSLLFGTNLGISVALPVPCQQRIPKGTGRDWYRCVNIMAKLNSL